MADAINRTSGRAAPSPRGTEASIATLNLGAAFLLAGRLSAA